MTAPGSRRRPPVATGVDSDDGTPRADQTPCPIRALHRPRRELQATSRWARTGRKTRSARPVCGGAARPRGGTAHSPPSLLWVGTKKFRSDARAVDEAWEGQQPGGWVPAGTFPAGGPHPRTSHGQRKAKMGTSRPWRTPPRTSVPLAGRRSTRTPHTPTRCAACFFFSTSPRRGRRGDRAPRGGASRAAGAGFRHARRIRALPAPPRPSSVSTDGRAAGGAGAWRTPARPPVPWRQRTAQAPASNCLPVPPPPARPTTSTHTAKQPGGPTRARTTRGWGGVSTTADGTPRRSKLGPPPGSVGPPEPAPLENSVLFFFFLPTTHACRRGAPPPPPPPPLAFPPTPFILQIGDGWGVCCRRRSHTTPPSHGPQLQLHKVGTVWRAPRRPVGSPRL